jgi:TolB-like protein
MKKILMFIVVAAVCLVWPGMLRADYVKTKIAVLDFELKGEGFASDDMGAIVAEWFITALVKEGRFDVIERSLLNKILEEQKLGISGIIDEDTATQIGKLLGVKVIISGSVMQFGSILEINSRIIDVQTASIIAAENVRSMTAERLQDLVVQMAAKIIKHFPLEGYVVSRQPDENMIAIDLGRTAGVKTGMTFIVFKEGKMIKHPKTGEVLDVERILLGRVVITDVRDKIADAQILEEKNPGAIVFGALVKSIGTPASEQSQPVPESVAAISDSKSDSKQDSNSRRSPSAISVSAVMQMLKSANYTEKTRGAKLVARYYGTNPELLKTAEEELLAGYLIKSRERDYADAMSWMCNVLGRSGDRQYRDTLREVSKNAWHRKVRGYAKKNYRQLR